MTSTVKPSPPRLTSPGERLHRRLGRRSAGALRRSRRRPRVPRLHAVVGVGLIALLALMLGS